MAHDVFGSPDGQTVVLLHGLTNSRSRYSHLVDWLSARHFGVVNVDLRGHGESGWSNSYRAEDYAADVAELIRTEGFTPAVVVGHSLGGVVASTLADKHPNLVRGLFMEDPPLFQADEQVRLVDQQVAEFPALAEQMRSWQESRLTAEELAADMEDWESPYPKLTVGSVLGPDRLVTRARAYLTCDPAAVDAAFTGEMWVGCDPEAPLACPVTVLAADESLDAMFWLEHEVRYLAVVNHAKIVRMAGAAHSILNAPAPSDTYLNELGEFLEGL